MTQYDIVIQLPIKCIFFVVLSCRSLYLKQFLSNANPKPIDSCSENPNYLKNNFTTHSLRKLTMIDGNSYLLHTYSIQ